MKIKTSELEGAALDWVVAKAVGARNVSVCAPMNTGEPICPPFVERFEADPWPGAGEGYMPYRPSTNWSQGGPLTEGRVFRMEQVGPDAWLACMYRSAGGQWLARTGPTLLIAAMRAIVAAELGDEVDVPEELLS